MLPTDPRLQTAPAEVGELEQLVSRDFKRHTARAYGYLRNIQDAEDAVQDALLSAFKHLSDFKSRAKLSTWLTSIVINAARAQRRKQKPVLSYEQLVDNTENPALVAKLTRDKRPSQEHICAQNEMFGLVVQMSEQLSPVCRRAVHLCLQGLSTAAASDLLGIPVPTFKAQLGRARKELKRRIAATRTSPELSDA
jgi:RNA polymerase sigma-70 factor (ECF subfamily)